MLRLTTTLVLTHSDQSSDVLVQQSKQQLPDRWILLDSCSTVDLISDRNLLWNSMKHMTPSQYTEMSTNRGPSGVIQGLCGTIQMASPTSCHCLMRPNISNHHGHQHIQHNVSTQKKGNPLYSHHLTRVYTSMH